MYNSLNCPNRQGISQIFCQSPKNEIKDVDNCKDFYDLIVAFNVKTLSNDNDIIILSDKLKMSTFGKIFINQMFLPVLKH